MAIEVTISTQPEQTIYGVWGESSDKTVAKDIPTLSKKSYTIIGKPSGSILPFYVLSRNYDKATGQFDIFIGGEFENSVLNMYCMPAGLYGEIAVRPKFGLLWGMAIGEAKQHFYTKWIPSSEHEAVNMEYELHTERSVVKKPEIDLLFAIKTGKPNHLLPQMQPKKIHVQYLSNIMKAKTGVLTILQNSKKYQVHTIVSNYNETTFNERK